MPTVEPTRGKIKRVGIVIPVYGHSRLVAEAISSACRQKSSRSYFVVAVDDGCPALETRLTLEACRSEFSNFVSIRRRNGGLSAARNTGVQIIRRSHPTTDAIFFLDSDNRLEPHALETYANALDDCSEAAWAFPDVMAFGLSATMEGVDTRETAVADSVLRHLAGNISEAGSLVRMSLFDLIAFDETMRSGLEDWDFWLSARERGCRGTRVRDAGFLYRVRPESMVAGSRRDVETIIAGMRRKHAPLFSPRAVYALEHEEAPRYLVADLDTGDFRLTSDPGAPGRSIRLDELRNLFHQHLSGIYEVDFPALIIITSGVGRSEWPAASRGLLFEAARDISLRPVLLKVEPGAGPERSYDQPRVASRIFKSAQRTVLLTPIQELYRVTGENPLSPARSVLGNVARLEHWTVPSQDSREVAPAPSLRRERRLDTLLRFLSRRFRPHSALRHAAKAYRGPAGQDVRSSVVDALCGSGNVKPFPFVSLKPDRCLLALSLDVAADDQALDALQSLAERLLATGFRISLSVDDQTAGLLSRAVAATRPENVIFNLDTPARSARFKYGDRDVAVGSAVSRDRLTAIARAHDILVSFGTSQFLPFLGEMKSPATVVVTAYPDALTRTSRSTDALIAIAAYEHAHDLIAVEPTGHSGLVNLGVPLSRLAPLDKAEIVIRSRSAQKSGI